MGQPSPYSDHEAPGYRLARQLLAVAPQCDNCGRHPATRTTPGYDPKEPESGGFWPLRCDRCSYPHWPDLPQAEAVRALSLPRGR